jgi:DNA-directed RNA polymerase subunit RPC12/RpoP
MKATCSNCQGELQVPDHGEQGGLTCPHCNLRLLAPASSECPVCKARLSPTATVCPQCGDRSRLIAANSRLFRTFFGVAAILVIVVCVVVGFAFVMLRSNMIDSSNRDIAKSQCKGLLTQAVLTYVLDDEVSNGKLPTSWDDVVKSQRADLKPESLNDPWGRQYHLDVPSKHNNTGGFDIWSDCGGSGKPVGNWKE